MINFQSDIGSLALRISTDIIENSASMPSCIETDKYCTASLGTCVDSGSLVRPDMLDHYRNHFGGLIAVDFTYAAGHCSFNTHTMNVETKAVCEKFLITLASQLGLSSNLSFHDDQNSRLVISDNELTFIEISAQLEDPAFCTFNSRLITRVILEHELMAKLIRSQISLDGVFSLLGQNTIQSCLDSTFKPGTVSPTEKEKLLSCIKKTFGAPRVRRSTVLEWMFSNGADVDKIHNKLVELGTVLNKNMRTISNNEFKLQVKERKLSQSLSSLDKRISFNLKHETALTVHQKRLDQVHSYSSIYLTAMSTELMNLDQISEDCKLLSILIMDTMTQESKRKCFQLMGTFRCVDFTKSSLNHHKNIVSFNLHVVNPTAAKSQFISCVPNMATKMVSTLHNSHLKTIGDDLVGKDVVVHKDKLGDKATVDQDVRDITEDDLILGNIFITTSPDRVVLSCFLPELIVVAGKQENCTIIPLYLKKSSQLKIVTSKGIVEESLLLDFKLTSKQQFVKQAHEIDSISPDSFRFETPQNKTHIHVLLEKLSAFTTPQIVGITMGTGALILTLCCAAGVTVYCCCGGWKCLSNFRRRFSSHPPRASQASEDLCQAAQPRDPAAAAPVPTPRTSSSDHILQDPVAERSLDLLRNKVLSLAALRNSPA